MFNQTLKALVVVLALSAIVHADAQWANQGGGLPGTFGVPTLAGAGNLMGGAPTQILLTSVPAPAVALLFISFARQPVPFKGGALTAFPPAIVLPVLILPPAPGFVNLLGPWPAGVPSNITLCFQYAVQDPVAIFGVSLSNTMSCITP